MFVLFLDLEINIKNMNSKTQNFLINIIGCLAFLSIPVFSSPNFNSNQNFFITPFLQHFSRYVLLLIFFYLNFFYFLPKLYFLNRKVFFYGVVIICFAIVYLLPEFIFFDDFRSGYRPYIQPNMPMKPPKHFIFNIIESCFFQFIFVLVISFLIKINQRFNTIKAEKKTAEISYLKAQINPHFLFNTLNSLYALTITKSDEAPNAVLKLSNMMRYVVTESSQDYVPLSKEINYIKDYIALQKLRINNDVNLSFNFTGNETGKSIAPLILIPFIENAFKYGINPDEESEVKIEIAVIDFNLTLISKNKIVVHEISDDLKTETGIENTKKRLDFIYPNKHLLEISEIDNNFIIRLNINLA